MPADDQAMALPCASVMVIIVLLKLALTWATPAVMFLRSRRRMRWGSRAMVLRSLTCSVAWRRGCERRAAGVEGRRLAAYFFFPAIGLALPLRVRALVWVRWPRTGR